MKKDSLIMNERSYARHLLFIFDKLDYIDKLLGLKIKNKTIKNTNNKSISQDNKTP
jgi:hypothetical protein